MSEAINPIAPRPIFGWTGFLLGAGAAIALGVGAIVFQLFAWAILMIVGMFVIIAPLHRFSGVFEGIFGG